MYQKCLRFQRRALHQGILFWKYYRLLKGFSRFRQNAATRLKRRRSIHVASGQFITQVRRRSCAFFLKAHSVHGCSVPKKTGLYLNDEQNQEQELNVLTNVVMSSPTMCWERLARRLLLAPIGPRRCSEISPPRCPEVFGTFCSAPLHLAPPRVNFFYELDEVHVHKQVSGKLSGLESPGTPVDTALALFDLIDEKLSNLYRNGKLERKCTNKIRNLKQDCVELLNSLRALSGTHALML